MNFKSILKRDGTLAPFESIKITNAVLKAFSVTQEGLKKDAENITNYVINDLNSIKNNNNVFTPEVEKVQDLVEEALILSGYVKTAKAYILYREKRSKIRSKIGVIPEHVKKLTQESKKFFKNSLAEFVYYRTYARWIEEENRRETWIETAHRYINYMKKNLGNKLSQEEYSELYQAILHQEAMPSMRLLQFAGKAAERTNVCAYNCSFIAPSEFQDFGEILYILMCGTGIGFSVESQNVKKFPPIKIQSGKELNTYLIPDDKEGWADALVFGIQTWFNGEDIWFDFSNRLFGKCVSHAPLLKIPRSPEPLFIKASHSSTKCVAKVLDQSL